MSRKPRKSKQAEEENYSNYSRPENGYRSNRETYTEGILGMRNVNKQT